MFSVIDVSPSVVGLGASSSRLPFELVRVTTVPPTGAGAPRVTVWTPSCSPLPTTAPPTLRVIGGAGVTVTPTWSLAIDGMLGTLAVTVAEHGVAAVPP